MTNDEEVLLLLLSEFWLCVSSRCNEEVIYLFFSYPLLESTALKIGLKLGLFFIDVWMKFTFDSSYYSPSSALASNEKFLNLLRGLHGIS